MMLKISERLSKLKLNRNLKLQKKYIQNGNSYFHNNFRLLTYVERESEIILKIGNNTILDCVIVFETNTGNVAFGNSCWIGNSTFNVKKEIHVGDNVFISWGCNFVDHDSHSIFYLHRIGDQQLQLANFKMGLNLLRNKNWDVVNSAPIKICSNAWIGMNCTILKGVTIGEGAIVGAGSVVTKDVEPWTIVGGNPAKKLKDIPEELRKK